MGAPLIIRINPIYTLYSGVFIGYMDVSEHSGTPKSSILIGFSIIFTIHFGVPLFLETPISPFKGLLEKAAASPTRWSLPAVKALALSSLMQYGLLGWEAQSENHQLSSMVWSKYRDLT